MLNIFRKIKTGLEKTRNAIGASVDGVLKSFATIGDEVFDELEEALIGADMGVETAIEVIEKLRRSAGEKRIKDAEALKAELKEILYGIMPENTVEDGDFCDGLTVILIVGVNGVGKTTSIGKLAGLYNRQGKKVLLAAGDTFRAAAGDQLEVWAERTGTELVRHNQGADPSAVIFDALNAARARKVNLLICDTAGRLHNKQNLMNELKKINKVINREAPSARVLTYLVLDATTGQNAIVQAESFDDAVGGLSGIILTKLDGTAKGGIVLAIARKLKVPVRFLGVGEGIDDIIEFDARAFVDALI
ncbi:MAG: signal recognition particle-docking protein FtsY [Clostridiales bacterium]|jgi:fused signal recognition particle receptor|nr:signal recognition particle-docking protein FtsY [Clostridiales bacterium]